MGEKTANGRWVLRQLAFVPRLVIAVFLISVGIGYCSALVQLHAQHARAGQLLPGLQEVKDVYSMAHRAGLLEKLITNDESLPFNSTGQMRSAFFSRSSGWKKEIRLLVQKKIGDKEVTPAERAQLEAEATAEVRKKREPEPAAVVAWIRAGADAKTYQADPDNNHYKFVLPAEVAASLTDDADPKFFMKNEAGQWTANIKRIIDERCVRCHSVDASGAAARIHLDHYEDVMDYITPDYHDHGRSSGSGMSLSKLAQTTHVHLLGFSMLYGLTGFLFACTSYPGIVRFVLAPLALLAQVGEISCWWLARADPFYASGIMALGGVVALSLGAQIVLTLFDLFEGKGKVAVLALLLLGAAAGVGLHLKVVEPHLQQERLAAGMNS